MAKNRIWGAVLALAGGTLLAFLLYQSMDRRLNAASIYTTGMPGSLLLGLVAIIVLAFGLHLATKRATPRR